MKIFITGSSGFIGQNLVQQFSQRYELSAPSRQELDLLDTTAVREYLADRKFDVIIHAAGARSNRLLGCRPDLLEQNCRMFFNLSRNAHTFGRMFFLSSGAVYDRAQSMHQISEDAFDLRVPTEPYGFSKYICAKAIDATENICELRLFGVFGPYEDWRVRFLSNACCRVVWNVPVVLRQNVFFDYLDVEDLGCVLERIFQTRLHHLHYNVCTGRTYDLKRLAHKIVAVSGKPLEILIRKDGLGVEYSGDNTRLMHEIPTFQFRNIDDSIMRLYRWYEGRKLSVDPTLLRFDE